MILGVSKTSYRQVLLVWTPSEVIVQEGNSVLAYTIGILLHWSKIVKVYREGVVYPSWKIRWNYDLKPNLGPIFVLAMTATS